MCDNYYPWRKEPKQQKGMQKQGINETGKDLLSRLYERNLCREHYSTNGFDGARKGHSIPQLPILCLIIFTPKQFVMDQLGFKC